MPSAARSLADSLRLAIVVRATATVRSQISMGLCSTQPERGRICSCSNWCRPTSLPPWSKIMNLVLVVPWSIAPTKSAMSWFLSDVDVLGFLGRGQAAGLEWPLGRQGPPDQHLVGACAEQTADDWPDDRD